MADDEKYQATSTPKRWCTQCEKYVEGKGTRKNVCPHCGAFTAKYAPEDKPDFEKEVEPKKTKQSKEGGEQERNKEYTMTSLRPANLTGREMATAEVLINSGLAKNFNDLVRKGIDLIYRQAHLPFQQQLNKNSEEMQENQNNSNPKKKMQELQEQNMLEAYIDNMKKSKQGNPFDSLRDLQQQKLLDSYINNMSSEGKTDPIQFMLMKSMMDSPKENNKNDFTDKIFQMQMMKSLSGENNQETTALQKEIADLKYQMQTQQLMNQQRSNTPVNDQLTALEKIRTDRDEKVRQAELQAQQARDKMLEYVMSTRIQQLEERMQQTQGEGGGSQRIKELADQIESIRKLSGSLGIREKSTGETFMEGIGNVAGQLAPALTGLMKQQTQAQIPPPAPQTPPPAPIQANPENLQPENLQPENPQQTQNPNPHPSSTTELTPSEKQLSDTMADMYLKKKNK